MQQLKPLPTRAFIQTPTNVLALRPPAARKSHPLCAVGHALLDTGHSVLCAPA